MSYRKVQNCKTTRLKLVARGYKYFSKLSAAGPDTSLILQNIKKCVSLKFTYKFEFDPYLCDKSNLKPLCKVLEKLKHIKDFNLIIRRGDYMNESDLLVPYLPRLNRLEKFRIELPRTTGMNIEGVIKLAIATGKLYSVRSLEEHFPEAEEIPETTQSCFGIHKMKMRRLRKVKMTYQKPSGGIYDSQLKENIVERMKRVNYFEEVVLNMGMSKGWFPMNSSVDETSNGHFRLLSFHKNLKRLTLKFRNLPGTQDIVEILAEILPEAAKLRYLSLEFQNSGISENELVLLAQTCATIPQVENLNLKVLQYPNVSEESIIYFISVLSKLKNFKTFNAYFRRITFPEEIMKDLMDKATNWNVGCEQTKQSVHFFRYLN